MQSADGRKRSGRSRGDRTVTIVVVAVPRGSGWPTSWSAHVAPAAPSFAPGTVASDPSQDTPKRQQKTQGYSALGIKQSRVYDVPLPKTYGLCSPSSSSGSRGRSVIFVSIVQRNRSLEHVAPRHAGRASQAQPPQRGHNLGARFLECFESSSVPQFVQDVCW